MAESRIDPLDVGALERSVNDSATRVSAIWLSFVAFSAYLAAAAATISHRQLVLQDSIKLPTINIDVPLVVSAILLPLLFVIYHVYVLLQVVLLSRTADAYNDAVNRAVGDAADQTRIRQRLANTVFAQLFAGSSREREGLLGWLLRIMAWVTLALAPPLVLIVFQLQFLPYHGFAVTWTHRLLIAFDLLAVLTLWAAAVDPRGDATWRRVLQAPVSSSLALLVVAFSWIALTFPGEPHAGWTRHHIGYDADFTYGKDPVCHQKSYLATVLSPHFDRIAVVGEQMIDTDKLRKIEEIAKARGQKPHEGERTRNLRGRNLRCGNLGGVDLRRADFSGADLAGANLAGADLQGAVFKSLTRLSGVSLAGALLNNASFEGAELQGASLSAAHLQSAVFNKAKLQGADLEGADLTDAQLNEASLEGAQLAKSQLQRASLVKAHLEGARLTDADLSSANLEEAHLEGATLTDATLSGANLGLAKLQGANLVSTTLRGTNLRMATLHAADLSNSSLEGANLDFAQLQGALLVYAQLDGTSFHRASLVGVSARGARFPGAVLVQTQLQGSDLDGADFTHALVDGAFLWRSTRAACMAAQVIKPRFDDVIAVTFGAHTATGERLFPATAEALAEWITETLKSVSADEREKRRAALEQQFAANPASDEADATQQAWFYCEDSVAFRDDLHQQRAAFLLKDFCELEPRDLPAAEGFFRNWISRPQGYTQGDEFDRTMVRGLLDKSCAGAAGLSKDSKDELQKRLKQ